MGFFAYSNSAPQILSGEVIVMSKQSAYFTASGLDDKHQVKRIKKSLNEIPGVLSVSTNIQKNRVAVDYDSSGTDVQKIKNHLQNIGIDAALTENQDHTM